MADKLGTLARIRRLQADMARADLANALHAEHAAEAELAEARQAPVAEAAHAPTDPAHQLAGAYARWLPAAAAHIARRAAEVQQATVARLHASDEAAARKAALEAIETLIAERDLTAHRRMMRKAQLELDELGTRRRQAS